MRNTPLGDDVSLVRDLWMHGEDRWDKDRVIDLYEEIIGNKICNIPIVDEGPDDRVIWFHAANGVYTTKSRYSWLILRKLGHGPHKFFWRSIWKLKIPPKVRIFT